MPVSVQDRELVLALLLIRLAMYSDVFVVVGGPQRLVEHIFAVSGFEMPFD
jgi:hypothetical protein